VAKYVWSDLITDAVKYKKGIPTSSIDAITCDKVSAIMWNKYPWYDAKSNIPAASIPLVTGTQDYNAPTLILRLLKLSVVRTDTTPDQPNEIVVSGDLPVDLVNRSPYAIRCGSLQAAVGSIRLESSVQVPTGTTWEIQGEYQLRHTKITATSQQVWFKDEFIDTACEGLLYFFYKLADDPRAGRLEKVENGRAIYSGQLAAFHAGIDAMYAVEDYGGIQNLFPDEPMGGMSSGGFNIYP
jgi:hypothetical protein